jgi:hypothetical protein
MSAPAAGSRVAAALPQDKASSILNLRSTPYEREFLRRIADNLDISVVQLIKRSIAHYVINQPDLQLSEEDLQQVERLRRHRNDRPSYARDGSKPTGTGAASAPASVEG